MTEGGATAALLATAAAMVALRGAGMLLAGTLRPDHPVVRWASAVSQAVLVLAVVAPAGASAGVAAPARVAVLAAGLAAYAATGGRMLVSLGSGLGALLAARALLQ